MYVTEDDISSAYLESLEKVVKQNYVFALMIRVREPIVNSDLVDEELNLSGININQNLHNKFKSFVFRDGKSGRWWIKDRVRELFEGIYHRAIVNYGQLEFAQKTLKEIKNRRYSWSSNRLLCLTFDPKDKYLNHTHSSRQPLPPCLTLIDFKPEKDTLHLIASWRAQYFDTKAYGNLISLAILLDEVCKNTGYTSGNLVSIAHKAILKDKKDAKRLLQWLKS